MPHLKMLVVHSLLPDEPITPPCAWKDLWILNFNGDLRQLSRLPLAGLEALCLERYAICVGKLSRSMDSVYVAAYQ